MHTTASAQHIRATDVLDVPEATWQTRAWSERRELNPEHQAFCDVAASQALAIVSRLGGAQPDSQHFLHCGTLDAWRGEFSWGRAWCASRAGEFWAWAQGDAVSDARIEIAGPLSMWDDELADIFAQSLSAGAVDKS